MVVIVFRLVLLDYVDLTESRIHKWFTYVSLQDGNYIQNKSLSISIILVVYEVKLPSIYFHGNEDVSMSINCYSIFIEGIDKNYKNHSSPSAYFDVTKFNDVFYLLE